MGVMWPSLNWILNRRLTTIFRRENESNKKCFKGCLDNEAKILSTDMFPLSFLGPKEENLRSTFAFSFSSMFPHFYQWIHHNSNAVSVCASPCKAHKA